MLTAVPGLVFSSPNALRGSPRGIRGCRRRRRRRPSHREELHGDVMNFGIARELLREDKIDTDVRSLRRRRRDRTRRRQRPGRRGLRQPSWWRRSAAHPPPAARTWPEVTRDRTTRRALRSDMAVALRPCTLPGADEPSFDLPAGQMELGIGIHGERGTERGRPARTGTWCG